MKRLRAGAYVVRRGAREAARDPLAGLGVAMAVAAAALSVGVLRLAAHNLERATRRADLAPQLVIYLDPEVSAERGRAIGAAVAAVPAVESVKAVSGAEAMAGLTLALGEDAGLVAGLEPDLLPDSLEVRFREGVRGVAAIDPFVDRLEALPDVDDVEVLGGWTERADALLDGLRAVGGWLVLLFAAAAALVVAALMRLGARPDPVRRELLDRLGAGAGFAAGPTIVAAGMRGAAGGLLACLVLYALFVAAGPAVSAIFAGSLGAAPLVFLPGVDLGALVLGGAAVGALGAGLATPRW